jgi:hypothetical protein
MFLRRCVGRLLIVAVVGEGGAEGVCEKLVARGLLGGFIPRDAPGPTLLLWGRERGDERRGEGVGIDFPEGFACIGVVSDDGLNDCLTSIAEGISSG